MNTHFVESPTATIMGKTILQAKSIEFPAFEIKLSDGDQDYPILEYKIKIPKTTPQIIKGNSLKEVNLSAVKNKQIITIFDVSYQKNNKVQYCQNNIVIEIEEQTLF